MIAGVFGCSYVGSSCSVVIPCALDPFDLCNLFQKINKIFFFRSEKKMGNKGDSIKNDREEEEEGMYIYGGELLISKLNELKWILM